MKMFTIKPIKMGTKFQIDILNDFFLYLLKKVHSCAEVDYTHNNAQVWFGTMQEKDYFV